MVFLNLDTLFLHLARAAARRRNAERAPPAEAADPRELQRMQDELRRAREEVRLQVTRGRLLW